MTPKHEVPGRAAPPPTSDSGPWGALEVVARRSSEARERLGAWTELLARETRKHPIRSVAVALGVGFVLGGGLFSRVTARLVGVGARIGLRMAIVPMMAQGLAVLAEGLRAPATEVGPRSSSHPEGKTRRRTHEAQ